MSERKCHLLPLVWDEIAISLTKEIKTQKVMTTKSNEKTAYSSVICLTHARLDAVSLLTIGVEILVFQITGCED